MYGVLGDTSWVKMKLGPRPGSAKGGIGQLGMALKPSSNIE